MLPYTGKTTRLPALPDATERQAAELVGMLRTILRLLGVPEHQIGRKVARVAAFIVQEVCDA